MAENIVNEKILIGKDTNEVKQLLGDPTYRIDHLSRWDYSLGVGGGGLGFIIHFLIVKIDEGLVVSVEHGEIRD